MWGKGTFIKAAISDTLAIFEFCCVPTDPSILFVLSVFHYCGTLSVYYCINTFMCHQNSKILNAKKELVQSWSEMKLLGRLREKKTLKNVSLQLISRLTRKEDLLIQKRYAKNYFGLFLVIVVEQCVYCSGISSVRAGLLELLIPSQKCSGWIKRPNPALAWICL